MRRYHSREVIYLMCIKKDLYMQKETCICEKRPVYVKRDLYMWKETCICEKRPVYVKRDLCMCGKRPVYVIYMIYMWRYELRELICIRCVKRDLYIWKETCVFHTWYKCGGVICVQTRTTDQMLTQIRERDAYHTQTHTYTYIYIYVYMCIYTYLYAHIYIYIYIRHMRGVLLYGPLCCGNSGQHTATHCNTLQHTATHCNTLQHTATQCNTRQHTATHCNTLQHTATHCNTLQHTETFRIWDTWGGCCCMDRRAVARLS